MPGPVERAVRDFLPVLPPGTAITVACSGGADSLALAWAVRRAVGGSLQAVVVDHGLQAGSADRSAATAGQLRALGYEAVSVRPVTVAGPGGPEAAARAARYAALDPGRPGAAVLLGHTLDDQAETVLLGLARGSGPRSVAGMSPWRAPWGRPLLGVRRRQTRECCAAAGLDVWDDPHNADPRFTRVRLRREVLPLLEDVLGGGVAPALARTAALMAEDLAALDALADDLLVRAGRSDGLAADVLRAAPAALRRRAVRRFLLDQGTAGLTADHLGRVERLLDGPATAAVRLPGGGDAVVRGGLLRLERAAPASGGGRGAEP